MPNIDYDADEFFRFLQWQGLHSQPDPQCLTSSEEQEHQRLLNEYGVETHDAVAVGPDDPASVLRADAILSSDCKPIPGNEPLICPRSQPRLPAALLPYVEQRCRTLGLVRPGQTVLWVGSSPELTSICTWNCDCDCFGASERRDRFGHAAAALVREIRQVLWAAPESEEFVTALVRALEWLPVLRPLRTIFKSRSEGLFPPRSLARAFLGLSEALEVIREHLSSTGLTEASREQFAEQFDALEQAAEEFFAVASGVWPRLAARSDGSFLSGKGDEAPEPCSAEAAAVQGRLMLEPGAFVYRNHRVELNGKPLQVLQALARARKNVLTLVELQNQCWGDSGVGEETVRSAVKVARAALRRAIEGSGISSADGLDPIPVVDRGTGRTAWRLELP